MTVADNFFGMTEQEAAAYRAQAKEDRRLEVERMEREISERKASDYHTNCRDCGRFVEKWRWVSRTSHHAVERGHRPICRPCWDEYDDYY